uniref:Uncharacterized protein n=1 Tax=Vitrella brassicaformis TaxID=1169539 RepID=A0A6U4AYW5_9ALVE|mmetsp:Transcript_16966/g.40704  ORF Transcript_16966/g.40704 Transcript_16966/m.40704 type:complete len:111 (+) Transcript_16966:482-814(+)
MFSRSRGGVSILYTQKCSVLSSSTKTPMMVYGVDGVLMDPVCDLFSVFCETKLPTSSAKGVTFKGLNLARNTGQNIEALIRRVRRDWEHGVYDKYFNEVTGSQRHAMHEF